MDRLDTIPALDFANEQRGDVFSIEFSNGWDARQARRTAELGDVSLRPSIRRPGLATGLTAVRRRFAPRRVSQASAD